MSSKLLIATLPSVPRVFNVVVFPLGAATTSGNLKLQNQLARWQKKSADLDAMKVCKACGAATEDEEHLLMHCSAYDRVRQMYPWVSFANSLSKNYEQF